MPTDDYGLVIGNHNNIQISSNYRNLPVWYSGTASGIGSSGWSPLVSYEPENWKYGIEPPHKHRGWIHYPGLSDDALAIAFRPGYSWYVTSRIGHGIHNPEIGYKYEPYLLCEGPFNKTVAPDSVEYVVYSYKAYDNIQTNQYGLEFRNAQNEISFHSDVNHLKIREMKSFTPSSLAAVDYGGDSGYSVFFYSQTISHATENPYYILPYIGSHVLLSVKVTPDMDYWCYSTAVIGLKKISATSCRVSFFIYSMRNYASLGGFDAWIHAYSHPLYIAICTL